MYLAARRTSRIAAVVFVSALVAAGCGDDPAEANDDNQGDDFALPVCEADSWHCEQFVDGTDLTVDRYGHNAVVLDEEHVLILGGREYVEGGGVTRTDTWEVVNVQEDRVEIEATEFEQPHRDPSVLQMENGSVMMIGGRDAGGDRLSSAKFFSRSELEWMGLDSMNAPYREATLLDDDRALAAGISHSGDGPAGVVGQVFDPVTLSWSSISSADLLHDRANEFVFEQLPDGDLLFVYSHPAPEEDQANEEIFESDDMPYSRDDFLLYETTVVRYDFESGQAEELEHFGGQAFGWSFQLDELEESGRFMLHLHSGRIDDDAAEAFADQLIEAGEIDGYIEEDFAYLFDPEDEQFDQQYRQEDPPGNLLEVLPGEVLIYDGGPPVQFYEIESDAWFDFQQMPDDIYYSTMDLLGDCRLFVAGERTYASLDDRRDVHTGYCEPAD